MSTWIEFNIHNSATFRVASDAPTAALLRDMFEPFLATGIDEHDLTIKAEMEPLQGASYGENDYEYTQNAVNIKAVDVQVIVDQGKFHLNGKRELLVQVMPLLDRILVTRNVAWVHAATVDYRGLGICLPAWGGVGKTSTIAKLLKVDGVGFMGDDWAFLSADGHLLGYAKPMSIKPHHRPLYPHLFKRRRKPLVPPKLSGAVKRVTSTLHPIVTQYPRLATLWRKWSPEHMIVKPSQAFPHARISTAAPLAAVIFLERYEGAKAVLHERDKSWMVSRMLGNFHAETTPFSHEVITALGATNLVPIQQYFSEKAAVLDRALEGKPTFLLQVPRSFSADRASDDIVEHIHQAFSLAGVQPG